MTSAAGKHQPAAAAGEPPASFMTDQQNMDLLMGFIATLGAMALMRVFFQAMYVFYILAFPAVFVYGLMTCPDIESFDAKKELKRVLRGYHLPESDPNKPKGILEKAYAKVTASVTTELATGLGYEVTLYPFLGAAILAAVRVPGANMDCYWIGAFGKWRYLLQQEISKYKAE
jgi:hypothetical protein